MIDFPMDMIRVAYERKAESITLTHMQMLRIIDWGEQLKNKANELVRENWRLKEQLAARSPS